jgi:hypothetical protein
MRYKRIIRTPWGKKLKIRISVLLLVLLNVAKAIEAADTPSPELEQCFVCQKPGEKRCTKCWVARYCGKNCQTKDWPNHKAWCKQLPLFKAPISTKNLDFTKQFSSEEIWKTYWNLYQQGKQKTAEIGLTNLEMHSYFDGLTVRNPVAPTLLFYGLECLKTQVENIKTIRTILFPGIGYISPLELAAFNKAFETPTIYGFDVDALMLEATKSENKTIAQNIFKADGTNANTWARYQEKNIDAVLFMHPLFTMTFDHEHFHLINDGKKMLENCARNFPNKQVIIITKSGTEAQIIMRAMKNLNFQNIQLIDNIKHAFPCVSIFVQLSKMLVNNMMFRDKYIELTENRADDLVKMWSIYQNDEEINNSGEFRYHFFIVAMSPDKN